jgi:hypothetical protein
MFDISVIFSLEMPYYRHISVHQMFRRESSYAKLSLCSRRTIPEIYSKVLL